MTFIAKATQVAVEEFVGKYGEGSRASFLHDMAFFLEELGYTFKPEERVKFYLTNTLEMEELSEAKLPGLSSLAEESHQAGKVKKGTPILVVLGNPPYSVSSGNKSEFIEREMEAYKEAVRGERNLMPLSDDYVKFIRFAEWKIAQAGEGVIGMITNHSYLDSPTFRGMRQHLMNTFDEIYVLDLHGNSLKKERCPDGSKDENVFDIRQGVAIAFFIKGSVAARLRRSVKSAKEDDEHHVFHAECFGVREEKYAWLNGNDWAKTGWGEIHPHSEFYLFVPRDETLLAQYKRFVKITDIFPISSTGIKTHRDHFVIDFDKETLKRRIRTFLGPSLPDDFIRETFKLKDTHTWSLTENRKKIQQDKDWERKIVPYFYRPFDIRWLFYHRDVIDRGREEVMRHMLDGNLALVICRQQKCAGFHHAFVTVFAGDGNAISLDTKEYNHYLPLYLYPDVPRGQLFIRQVSEKHVINISSVFLEGLKGIHSEKPEIVFHYIYAILYSNVYREKYTEFLRTDFPRIPFTSDHELFDELAALGKRLVDLHLLRSDELDSPIAKFEGDGDRIVQTGKNGLRYEPKTQRVFINETQHFEGIPPQVWEYQIGGYQVCHKWLKDRKDRHLSLDEIKTYCRIVTALAKTIEIQAVIDELYPMVEETLLAISSD